MSDSSSVVRPTADDASDNADPAADPSSGVGASDTASDAASTAPTADAATASDATGANRPVAGEAAPATARPHEPPPAEAEAERSSSTAVVDVRTDDARVRLPGTGDDEPTSEPRPARPTPIAATGPVDRVELSKEAGPLASFLLAETVVLGFITAALAWIVYEWWRIPFGLSLTYGGDELAGLAHVKGVDETGWWFTNPRLGAPFELEHYDFPHGGDSFQVAVVRFISLFSDAPATILNAYYLCTFALVAMAAHLVLRHLRFGLGISATVAVLYAFLPFHFEHHVGHIYRSGYYAAPLGALVLLWLAGYDGGLSPGRDDETGRRRLSTARVAVTLLTVALIATTDTVAASFAPAIAGVLGVLAVLRGRSWRRLVACLSFAAATVAMVVVVNVPTLLYRQANGANPETVQRQVLEQELYALRLAMVVLPDANHPIEPLREISARMRRSPIRSEGGQALGVIGVLGLVGGIAAALPLTSPARRRSDTDGDGGDGSDVAPSPTADRSIGRSGAAPPDGAADRGALARTSGLLMLLIIVIAVPSGLSYLTSLAGLEEIRTWNRIVVYLGFLALLNSAIGLERIGGWLRRQGVGPAFAGVGLLGLLAFGLFDQTPGTGFRYEPRIEGWNRDAQFFDAVETSVVAESAGSRTGAVRDALPSGGWRPMVFQFPVTDYPEPSDGSLLAYDHFRGYLHTDTLAWSHGAMRGRPASQWQRQLRTLPAPVALDALTAIGFEGIYVDKVGYLDDGDRLRSLVPDEVLVEDDRQFYISLEPRAAHLESTVDAPALNALALEVLDPVTTFLGEGFHGSTTLVGGVFAEDEAAFELRSSDELPRRVELQLTVITGPGDGNEVWLLDEDGEELARRRSSADRRTVEFAIPVEVPSDGLRFVLATDGPEYQANRDPRQINMELLQVSAVGPAVAARVEELDAAEIPPLP